MANPFIQKTGLVSVDRAEGQDGFGEDSVPVDRSHPAGFEELLVSVDIVCARTGGRVCRGMFAQICEKLQIGLEVLLDRAPRAERTTKLGLPAQSSCKREGEGPRMLADKINLDSSAVARLDVEAKSEHQIAGMRGSDTIGW